MSYVYAYLDPRKSGIFNYQNINLSYEPFYVGKGTGKRDKSHLWRFHTHLTRLPFYDKLQKLIEEDIQPIIIRLVDNLSSEEAYRWERNAVEKIGRKDLGTGPLLNLRDGGSEYTHVSEITKQRMRTSHLGQQAWNKGKVGLKQAWNKGIPMSEEIRQKVSAARKGQPAWNKGIFGVIKYGPRSKETCNLIRNKKMKQWYVTPPTGIPILVSNLKLYCHANNLTYANMCAVGRGLRKHHKYFTCRRIP